MQQLRSAQHCDLSELTFVAVGEEEETSLLRVAAHKVVNNDTWQLNHSAIEGAHGSQCVCVHTTNTAQW